MRGESEGGRKRGREYMKGGGKNVVLTAAKHLLQNATALWLAKTSST